MANAITKADNDIRLMLGDHQIIRIHPEGDMDLCTKFHIWWH